MQTLDVNNELVEVPNINRAAAQAINAATSVEDKITLALNSYGRREVFQSVQDIAARAQIKPVAAYQGLYRLANKGKIQMLKESSNGGKREKVVGVKLNYAPQPLEVLEKAAEKAKSEPHHALRKRMEPKVSASLVVLSRYMERKVAIEKARQILLEAGIPEEVVTESIDKMFTQDPLGEEGIAIYSELIEVKRQLAEAHVDQEVNRRAKEFVTE